MPWYRTIPPGYRPGLFHWTDNHHGPLCGSLGANRYPSPDSEYRDEDPLNVCGTCARYVQMRRAKAQRKADEAAAATPETDPNQLPLFNEKA